jgi:hypothetical protein
MDLDLALQGGVAEGGGVSGQMRDDFIDVLMAVFQKRLVTTGLAARHGRAGDVDAGHDGLHGPFDDPRPLGIVDQFDTRLVKECLVLFVADQAEHLVRRHAERGSRILGKSRSNPVDFHNPPTRSTNPAIRLHSTGNRPAVGRPIT